jgi:hypothetical protein
MFEVCKYFRFVLHKLDNTPSTEVIFEQDVVESFSG